MQPTTPLPEDPEIIVATLTPLPFNPDQIQPPSQPPETENLIDWLVANVVVPLWNFLYTFFLRSVVALWDFAGERGGLFAQVFCCIVPFLLVGALLVRRALFGRDVLELDD